MTYQPIFYKSLWDDIKMFGTLAIYIWGAWLMYDKYIR